MNYKELFKYEKLAKLQGLNLCKCERHSAAVYLKALWLNDTQTIEEYESLGNDIRHILMNKRSFDQGLKFGFNSRELDKNGWLVRPTFLEPERIEFKERDGWAISNYITLGKGKNGIWTFGISYSYSTGGYGRGIGIWGKLFNTRKECLKAALSEFMTGLSKDSDKNDRYAVKVLNQAKNLFDEITGRKAVQLTINFF